MDLKTWEKIKSELKSAHPLARIRKLHPIINNQKISKKIRDEAKELASKARVELDSEQFWKWGGVSLLPTRSPKLEEAVKEEPKKKVLEETVEAAAPTKKPEEKMDMKYGGSESEYESKGYFGKTYKSLAEEPEGTKKSRDPFATPSETVSEAKYERKKKKNY